MVKCKLYPDHKQLYYTANTISKHLRRQLANAKLAKKQSEVKVKCMLTQIKQPEPSTGI